MDAILYQIDPSLVSKEAVARLSPDTLPDRSNQATDGLKPSKPVTGSVVPAKSRTDLQSDSLTTTRQVEKAEAEPIPSSSRTSPELLQGLAGKAIARKYDVYSSDKTESTLTRVPNPILVPRRSPPSSAEKMKSTSISQPPSPITSVSTSVEASPTYTRFLNIAGRSSRDQAEAEAARLKASGVSSKPQVDSDSQPGRTSIFNKTSIRPALPPKRNGTSSESDGSPPSTRQSSYRSRPAPAPIKYRGPSKAINGRVTELPTVHRWELNEIEKPRSFVQGRYISSGEIIDPVANMRKADFTGYQNGWKPVSSRFGGGHSGGNVLGGSPSRRQKADYNGAEEEERDAGPAPFHWTGDVDVDVRKRHMCLEAKRKANSFIPSLAKDVSLEKERSDLVLVLLRTAQMNDSLRLRQLCKERKKQNIQVKLLIRSRTCTPLQHHGKCSDGAF